MHDVAREAGVGVATVDRILNRRAHVRPETAQRVLAAAERLGFRRAGLLRHRIDDARAPRLGFLLQQARTPFYRDLARALVQACADEPAAAATPPPGRTPGAVVEHLDELTPQRVVDRLERLAAQVDAVALVAADHPQVNQAIDRLAAAGKPVFALVSDLSADGCAGHVGLDNRRVGRTAAWAVSRLARGPGKVGLILGSHRYLCQEQCEISFRSHLREHAPGFGRLETLVSLEEPPLAQIATLELLDRHPDLVGLYVAGGGIEGVIEALRAEAGRHGRIVTVCHDLTEVTRQALIDGTVDLVISHPLDWMAARLVATMRRAVQGGRGTEPVQVVVPFVTHTAASV
ncbi:MAG: hypothetical protein RL456_2454 [Pseudomonadota bacterium]